MLPPPEDNDRAALNCVIALDINIRLERVLTRRVDNALPIHSARQFESEHLIPCVGYDKQMVFSAAGRRA